MNKLQITNLRIIFGVKLFCSTEYGLKREMVLLNDLCLNCKFRLGKTEKYCDKIRRYIYSSVKDCPAYVDKTLDEFVGGNE